MPEDREQYAWICNRRKMRMYIVKYRILKYGTLHIASCIKEKGHAYDTHRMSNAYKM